MSSKSQRRILLSVLALALFLLPSMSGVAQAAGRPRAEAPAVAHLAAPAQWLARIWQGVSGLWQAVIASDSTGGTTSQPGGGTTSNGDAGITIDPDGRP